ncbi:MAG: type IV pilus modification PilV family protein [Gemmatimonadota bacterium]
MNDQTSARGGFSLVEIIAAIMILSFGLLAMAASTGYVSAQMRSSMFDTQRNLARQQVIEQLRGTIYTNLANPSSATIGNYTITWRVTAQNAELSQIELVTTGPAYRAGRGARTTVTDNATIQIVSPQ